ncbi:MAG: HU family DNA-binding protein [Prevotellaceae bacterium]|jgi:DNA-binding protein HU-beta|nr:HU family DNA-binding protein [Prevotellaceae bacterium]
MNKNELVGAIAEKTGLTKVDSKKALDAFEASVTEALAAGESVALIGFGTFSITDRAARIGVNPATGAKIQIEAKKVVKFKAGVKLAEAV